MNKKVKEKRVECIMYLSTDGDMKNVELREKKQERYIREYAKAHNIRIIKTMHRDVLGQTDVNNHFVKMVEQIRNGNAQGIILASIMKISKNLPDAYRKVGLVHEAGGQMITVDEGRLGMKIKECSNERI